MARVTASGTNLLKAALMLSAYCDESSDEKQERVFVVAGVIGSEQMWQEMEGCWTARTSAIPFHANHCDSDQGLYRDIDHAENKKLYRDLITLLAQSGLGGWAFAIDIAAQQKAFQDAPDIIYYRCFVEVVRAMMICAINNKERVAFTFDERHESQHNAKLLYNMLASEPQWGQHIHPQISFSISSSTPRLQVADLFAREAMKAYDNRFGPVERPVRKSWDTLRRTDRFHITAISNAWFQDLKNEMPMLHEKTGMSPEDYFQWRKKRNLQHSITNLFIYMQWSAETHRGDE